jgi:hypothetical protein
LKKTQSSTKEKSEKRVDGRLQRAIEERLPLVNAILANSSIKEYEGLVKTTLLRIPTKDLQRIMKTIERVVLIPPNVYATTIATPRSDHEQHTVLLLEEKLEKCSQFQKKYAVAHEFAHVYLEDYYRSLVKNGGNAGTMRRLEKRVDNQVLKWGFITENQFNKLHLR